MIDFTLGCLAVLLYFAIGIFLDTLFSDSEPSLLVAFFWPLLLFLVIMLYVCLYIPSETAKKIKNWLDKRDNTH